MSTNEDIVNHPFTFHGDLLGIANYYSIDQELAKKQLDIFYDLIFEKFRESTSRIFLFSDSVFITGSVLEETLKKLGEIYMSLLYKNIFMKGALIKGELTFDPRITVDHIRKELPSTDVLYRAISLQKGIKGMRLLIEKELAKELLPREWLTDHDYRQHVDLVGYDKFDFRRKIILAREWNTYEYLWMMSLNTGEMFSGGLVNFFTRLLKSPRKVVEERLNEVPDEVMVHLKETQTLFSRANSRYTITHEKLNLSEVSTKVRN